jgi:hypothetical protein
LIISASVGQDLPANKLIEFKFLLRGEAGHVRWQDGDNRTLQATDTPNTLVVNEDWDHDRNQKVSEEEELWIAEEEGLTLSDDLALEGSTGTMLADELQSGENLESNKSAVADACLHGEVKGANEENQSQVIQNTPSTRFLLSPGGDNKIRPEYHYFYDHDKN